MKKTGLELVVAGGCCDMKCNRNPQETGESGSGMLAAYANLDEYGMMQNARSAPRFNKPGTTTEGMRFS